MMEQPRADIKTDFCVVGAGPAGAVLASKLVDAGRSCVLVEEGPRYSLAYRSELIQRLRRTPSFSAFNQDTRSTQTLHRSYPTSAGEPYRYPHEQAVGGTTVHWWANTPRPIEDDLQVRSRFGYGRDWPITYAELEPWLLAAEHELGVAGDDDNPYASPRSGPFPMPAHRFTEFDHQTVLPAFARLGWGTHSKPVAINSRPRQGRLACQGCRLCRACPSGARYSADLVHVPRFESAPSGRLLRARVRRLEVSSTGRDIVAAHAVDEDGHERIITAKVYILAAGGIETTRLLLLSRDPTHHPMGLGNLGGQLGLGLSCMYMHMIDFALPTPIGRNRGFPTTGCDYFRRREWPRSETPHFYPMVFPNPQTSSNSPVEPYRKLASSKEGQLSLTRMRELLGQGVMAVALSEMEGVGRIDLDGDEVDDFGDPRARVTYQRSSWERAGTALITRDILPRLAEAMAATAIGEIDTQFDGAHPTGTAAMARTPAEGTCDVDLKVFGLDNLYLASGAVFPHLGAYNTTLTIVALAARLAAHLSSRGLP